MSDKLIHSLRTMLAGIIRPKKEPRVEKMIDLENLRSLAAATMIVAVADLLFLLFSLLIPFGEGSTSAHPISLLCCAFACFTVSLLIRRYLKKTESAQKTNSRFGLAVLAALYLFMSVLSAATDMRRYQSGEQMLFFYIVQFCFLLFSSVKPQHGALLVTLSFGWFCARIVAFDGGQGFNYTSFFVFYALAVFGNAIKYMDRANHYRNSFAMEMQEEEKDIVIAQSGKYVSVYDLKSNIIYNDSKATLIFGLPPQQYDPQTAELALDFVTPESREAVDRFYGNMRAGIPSGCEDFKLKTLDGSVIWQHGDYTLQADESGEYVRSIISFSDVTGQMEQKLVHKQRINEILALAKDCDFYVECSVERWTVDDVHVVNDRMRFASTDKGRSIDEAIEANWKPIVHVDDYGRVEEFFSKSRLQLLNANGVTTDRIEFRVCIDGNFEWYCIELCLVSSLNLSELNFFAIFRNINAVHTQYDALINQATVDKLTGLYNRDTTMQAIQEFLSGSGALGTHALVMLDLDNLKKINDSLGHQVGDDALRQVGECLKRAFRQSDICGRIGGDEFFAFLKNISIEKVISKAKTILAEMQVAYSNNEEQLITSVSMGIAMYYGGISPAKTLRELYAEADAALYKAKALGKNTYAFSDERDVIAVDSSLSASLKNDLISYNLRGLFDNLASGIAIFHGNEANRLTPMFCNAGLPTLLNITQEQFFSHMTAENGYGIHPDDLDIAREILRETAERGNSTREVFRLLTGSGDYRYVTVFSNAHRLDDGSFDLYCIFSDAEEAEQLHRYQENHRRQLQKKRLESTESDVAYAWLNITKDICIEYRYTHKPNLSTEFITTAQELLSKVAEDIALADYRREFSERFTQESFRRDAAEGIVTGEMRVPFSREERSAHWYQLNSEISFNPESGDIEVFITFADIDNEVRLEYVIDRMLESEYEYLCQIDVRSGCIARIGENRKDGMTQSSNGKTKYEDVIHDAIEKLLPAEYWESGLDALSFERILSELANKDMYSTVFPVVLADGRGERLCQWNCEYMDAMHSTILMSRKNISKVLDYGYDSLTGMLARSGFYQNVKNELNKNLDRKYYMLEIDFDNFKLINEEQGYFEGNRFLRQFTANLYKSVLHFDKNACIGRFEADHFLIFMALENSLSPENVYNEFTAQIGTYPEPYRLGLRMGVYEVTDNTLDVALMCDCAHLAHKACKGSFAKRIEYYLSDLRDKMLDEQLLAAEMKNALDTEQFEVFFQAQVNHADNGSLVGAEALVRWNHPTRGMISPAVFIPLFENNGFIYELDKYVWRRTCRCIRRWLDEGMDALPVSVNISRIDILQNDFMDVIVSIMEEEKIPYDQIRLEITESALSENTGRVIDVARELIKHGFTVAIDDFGSGYSSLSMLKSVPAHILKLDMRFFRDDDQDIRNECIIESVIRMAKMLGMAVLAEGIEKAEQADRLHSMGCDYIQGFLYAKPLSYDDFMEYRSRTRCAMRSELGGKANEEAQTEQMQSYELLRGIISGSNDIIIVADIKTKQLLYANRAAEQRYNKRFDPMKAATCMDFCAEHAHCDTCPIHNLHWGERQERVFYHNGQYIRAVYSCIDWNGHDAFVFYQMDITSEMRELQLADSLIRNLPGAIIVFAPDENGAPAIHYLSEQAMSDFALTSIDKKEPSFEDFLAAVHPDDKQRICAAAETTFAKKEIFRGEFRVLLRDGSVIWIDLTVNPVVDNNGKYLFYALYSDITDRKNAQARADALIQHIPAAITIYEISADGMARVFISDSAKKILNTSEDTYKKVGMDEIYGRVHPSDRQRVRDTVTEYIALRKPFSIQFRLGTVSRWVQLDSTPITTTAADCTYYSVYTDISVQKQLELSVHEMSSLQTIKEVLDLGLQEALRQASPELSVEYIIGFAGRVLHGERTYIFEKNPDGTDSNTFEWVADGISPEKDNLQCIPEDVAAPWYEQFKKQGTVVIENMEDIRHVYPKLYEILAPQNIHSLVVTPFSNDLGEPMGFFGLDNPPAELLKQNAGLIQTIAYFIEANLKRRNLEKAKA